jgi:ABC-type transport system involved in multi-copper enzyme maturation permease subunit
VAATILTAVGGGWVACQIAAVDFWAVPSMAQEFPMGPHEFQAVVLLLMMLNVLYLSSLSFTASILSRSTVGGVLTGFAAPAFLVGVSQLSSSWARAVPGSNIENLLRTWMPIQDVFPEPLFNVPVSATQSVLVVVGFSLASLAVGVAVFTRRDIAGQ